MSLLAALFYGTALAIILSTIVSLWRMNRFFRIRGIKSPPVFLPIIGNSFDALITKVHFKDYLFNLYKDYPTERYIGINQFAQPIVVMRDLELIKQLGVKDFDHFPNHDSTTVSDKCDSLLGNILFSLKGQKWRDMRATLSPAFSSSNMKGMFQFIVDCGKKMTDHHMKLMQVEENKVRGLVEVEMKDAFTRYANDVIATCAFGLEVDSFKEQNNEFYLMGKLASDFTGKKFFKFLFMHFFPKLSEVFKVTFIPKENGDYFRKLVWDTIRDREKRKIERSDMIQLLMKAKNGSLKHDNKEDVKDAGFASVEEFSVGKAVVHREWQDDEIVAQALLFFIAGFETTSSLLCFVTHELALHQEIQKTLQEEIDEAATSSDGKLTYDRLQKMKYLDMVVSETLRMWPQQVVVDRKCAKPYTLPPANENALELKLKENDQIWFPIYSLHHDPQYYKDPEVFDPDRFSDENKENIKPFSYMPFGIGPRNCIGSRFALMEIKCIVYNLLLNFDLVPTAKTQHPIQLKPDTFLLQAINGFWVGMKPRNK